MTQTTVKTNASKAEATAAVAAFKFPLEPVTMKQVYEATGIAHGVITNFVKENADIVGDAPRAQGTRGKAAKLYKFRTK